MSLNLFIIGPSGCGKSTQAKMIAQKYSLTHLSMGQLLRNEIASESALGKKARPYVDKGTWVPNDVAIGILTKKLCSLENHNFIIDGFPRILEQGILAENYLESNGKEMTRLIHLDVTAQEIVNRRQKYAQSGIRFSDAGRTDETPESIAQRQRSYDETIIPILEHYKNTGKLVNIDGDRPVEPIFDDICQIIDKINI